MSILKKLAVGLFVIFIVTVCALVLLAGRWPAYNFEKMVDVNPTTPLYTCPVRPLNPALSSKKLSFKTDNRHWYGIIRDRSQSEKLKLSETNTIPNIDNKRLGHIKDLMNNSRFQFKQANYYPYDEMSCVYMGYYTDETTQKQSEFEIEIYHYAGMVKATKDKSSWFIIAPAGEQWQRLSFRKYQKGLICNHSRNGCQYRMLK